MAKTDNQISLIVNGNEYTEFESARVSRSLDCLGGSYECVVNNNLSSDFPLKMLDTSIIKVNGSRVLTGYIEVVDSFESPEEHNVSICGHDKTVDIVDSSIEQNSTYSTPISLKSLIENVIRDNMVKPFLTDSVKQIATIVPQKNIDIHSNMAKFYDAINPLSKIVPIPPTSSVKELDSLVLNMKVIDRTDSEESELGYSDILRTSDSVGSAQIQQIQTLDKTLTRVKYPAAFVYDIIAGDPGEKIFDYIDRHAKKKGCLLTTDGFGNIVIYRNSGEDIGVRLINRASGNGLENGCVKSSNLRIDMAHRYRRLIVRSQKQGLGDIQGIAFDNQVQLNRTKIITADDICDEEMAALMALWEVNKRRADSITYRCDVYGFWATENKIWEPNQIVDIQDEVQGVSTKMLLKEVTYSIDKENGSISSLVFVMPDSYALQANDPHVRYNNPYLIRYL